jgi:hypothetical protein
LLALGLIALGAPALAQTGALPDSTSAAPEPVDPERLAMAEKLFSAMHLDTAMHGVFASVFKSMAGSMTGKAQSDPKAQQFIVSIGAGVEAVIPEMDHDMAEAYARIFTKQELRDSLTFYESPSGRAIMNKMPEMMQMIAPMSIKLRPKIIDAAEADYCSRQTCTDAERAIFKRVKANLQNTPGAPAAAP